MVKFAVFGSSFVARLNTFCTGDMKNPGECNFFGLGGMKAENVSDSLLVKLRLYAPDVVFIHIGANDITKDSYCKTICENIQSLVGEIYKAGAKVVFVAEIYQRGNFTKAPGLTFQTYNKNKNSINRTLQKLFGDNFVKFKYISFHGDFGKDLVHFSPSGMKKYFSRIRRIFL
jgi:lysophospholipase L1-like esterase